MNANSGVVSGSNARRPAPGRSKAFLPLVLDVAVPLASYYLLRHFGVSLVPALAISGLSPALRVVRGIVRERTADGLALAVLVLTAASIPVAFISGTPQILLAKDAVGTGVFGLWLIVSALLGRPAMANVMRGVLTRTEGSEAAWDRLAESSPPFRSHLRTVTTLWGVGFVIECVARIAVAWLLPINTAVWAVNVPIALVISGCVVIQRRWVKQIAIMVRLRTEDNDRTNRPLALAA